MNPQEIMNHPMFKKMMNDPKKLQEMISSPMMQKVMENAGVAKNPMMESLLKDPSKLSEIINSPLGKELLKDPSKMKSAMNPDAKKFTNESKIRLVHLESSEFNNKEGIVKGFNTKSQRYVILVTLLNKKILVKEENLEYEVTTGLIVVVFSPASVTVYAIGYLPERLEKPSLEITTV